MQCAASGAESALGGRCKAPERASSTSGVRRRAWARPQPPSPLLQVLQQCPWARSLTTCRAASATLLSASAKQLVATISGGWAEPQEVLEVAMVLPAQDLLDISCQLLDVTAKPAARARPGRPAKRSPAPSPAAAQQLTARQLMLVLESRDDQLPQQLTQLPGLLRQLCQVLVHLNTAASINPSSTAAQQAEGLVSARLRWPRLLAWVCQRVLECPGKLDVATSSAVLQALSSAAHPTHPQVLLQLALGLLGLAPAADTPQQQPAQPAAGPDSTSSQQGRRKAGGQQAQHVPLGLQALAQLHALQLTDSGGSSELQACLEHAALLMASSQTSQSSQASQASHATLTELAQACVIYGCVPPSEFVTAVFQAAAAAQQPQPAQPAAGSSASSPVCGAAGLLVPFAHLSTGGLDSLQQLVRRLFAAPTQPPATTQEAAGQQGATTSSTGVAGASHVDRQGGQEDQRNTVAAPAVAFLSGLQLTQLRDGRSAACVAGEALAAGDVGLVALALRSMEHSQAARPACQGLIQWLGDRVDLLSLNQLCATAAAISYLQLEAVPGSQALLSLCQRQLAALASSRQAAAGSHSMLLPAAPAPHALLDLAHALQPQLLVAPAANSPAGLAGVPLAVLALIVLPAASADGGDSSGAAEAGWLAAQATLPRSLQVAAAQQVRQQQLQLLQALGSHAGRRLASHHPLQHARGWLLHGAAAQAAWLHPAELVLLFRHVRELPVQLQLDGPAGPAAAKYSQEPGLLPLLRVASLGVWGVLDRLDTPQVCEVLYCFGQRHYRPGVLVAAMVDKLHADLLASHGTDGRGRASPADSMDGDSGTTAAPLTAGEARGVVRACWALAQLGQTTAAARRLVRLATAAALVAHAAATTAPADSQPSFLTVAAEPAAGPAAGAAAAAVGVVAEAGGAGPPESAGGDPVRVGDLVTLLWCHAKMGDLGAPALLRVRGLMLAIMAHPEQCDLVQMGRVWWSAATLELSGARLTAWLNAATTYALQQSLAGGGTQLPPPQQAGQQGVYGNGAAASNGSSKGAGHGGQSGSNRSSGSSSDTDSSSGGSGSAAALGKLFWGMQQLDISPAPQLSALLLNVSVQHMHHMPASQLTQVVYALSQLAPSAPASAAWQARLGQLMRHAAAQLEQRLDEFRTPSAVHLVWALAKAGQRLPQSVLESIAARLLQSEPCTLHARHSAASAPASAPATTSARSTGYANGSKAAPAAGTATAAPAAAAGVEDEEVQEATRDKHVDDVLVSQFLWACSVCGHRPAALLAAYADCLPERLQRHYAGGRDVTESAAIVAAAAMALSSCRFEHSNALRALDDALLRYHQFLNGQQLSATLYGMALLGYRPQQHWSSLLSALRDRAPGMKLPELMQTMWALSQWPMDKILGHERLSHLRDALRPVLLVHVLGAQMSASAAYDAAGERTGATPAAGSASAPPAPLPAGFPFGYAFGRADTQQQQQTGATTPQQEQQQQQPQQPPAPAPASTPATQPSVGRGEEQERPGVTYGRTPTGGGPPAAVGEQPGIPFGRPAATAAGGGSAAVPPAQQQLLMSSQRPPLRANGIADLAVGAATLGVCTPDVAEAIAGWAMSEPAGGLARFSSRQLCALLWAFARCQHDRLSLFEGAAELICSRIMAGAGAAEAWPLPPAVSAAAPLRAAARTVPPRRHRLTAQDLQKLLWAWSKFNRHPGEELLEAVRIGWLQVSSPQHASGGMSVDALCGMIYALAVLREHRHPLMQLLTLQLEAALALQPASGGSGPAAAATAAAAASQGGAGKAAPLVGAVLKHAPQMAAAMLAAQAEAQESPLVGVLPTDVRMQVIDVWRRRSAQRASANPRHYVAYLMRVVTRMNIQHRVELSPDGIVCPDLTVTLSIAPGVRFALELVGPHNTASNSGRLLGDAALKYRLLQARGYLVVPISCKDWKALESNEDKMVYIQAKLDKRVAALAMPTADVPPGTMPAFASLSSMDGASGAAPVINVSARALPSRIEVAPRQPNASDYEILKPSDNRPH